MPRSTWGDYDKALKALQKRLAHIQVAYIVHKKRALIVFEGWDASGKGGLIRRLAQRRRHTRPTYCGDA